MDSVDRNLLNEIQNCFPLVEYPFHTIGEQAGIGQTECLQRIARLKREGIIRQISAIFDSGRLGYKSILVAASVDEKDVEEVARVINERKGVSHNYLRDHPFNIWFTLTLPSERSFEDEIGRMGEEARWKKILLLPSIRVFKIGVRLDMEEDADSAQERETMVSGNAKLKEDLSQHVSDTEKNIVRVLQDDLPLVPSPFLEMSKRCGMNVNEFLKSAAHLRERGIMRRFAAVLHHRRAGYAANGMGTWVVPKDQVEYFGRTAAGFKAVSHCYERPPCPPDWPYNLFTMIHARSEHECKEIAEKISAETGIADYRLLFSIREFKKVRVIYFEDD
ncbi:MAG: Lrp/AsnC family transcriptional regulator [Acidobacteriota bacterium]